MTVEPAEAPAALSVPTPGPAPASDPDAAKAASAFASGPEAGSDPSLPALAVSACLCGVDCTYKAGNHTLACLDELRKRYRLVLVCPETQGGLQAPRPPAEICGERVRLKTGEDVSAQFALGARRAVQTALEHGCEAALLKEKSPSCGFGRVYDGTISGTLVEGSGWGAAALARAGVRVVGDSHVRDLLD